MKSKLFFNLSRVFPAPFSDHLVFCTFYRYNKNTFVDTTFINIVNTLEASDYIKFDEHITGYAHAATFSDDTFLKRNIDEETIVIVGDRDDLIEKVEEMIKEPATV